MKKKQRTKTIEDERNKIEKPEKKKQKRQEPKKQKKKKFVSLHREGKRNRNGGHHLLPTAT